MRTPSPTPGRTDPRAGPPGNVSPNFDAELSKVKDKPGERGRHSECSALLPGAGIICLHEPEHRANTATPLLQSSKSRNYGEGSSCASSKDFVTSPRLETRSNHAVSYPLVRPVRPPRPNPPSPDHCALSLLSESEVMSKEEYAARVADMSGSWKTHGNGDDEDFELRDAPEAQRQYIQTLRIRFFSLGIISGAAMQ
jgi:hypothetical protein